MSKTLYIIRGPQGSGKSTMAKQLGDVHLEADQYFVCPVSGAYEWKPEEMADAHNYCLTSATLAMSEGVEKVAVSNTFAQLDHILPYQKAAKELGYKVVMMEMQNNFGNVHEVDEKTVNRVRSNMQQVNLPSLQESAQYHRYLKMALKNIGRLSFAIRDKDHVAAEKVLPKAALAMTVLELKFPEEPRVAEAQELFAVRLHDCIAKFGREHGPKLLKAAKAAAEEVKTNLE